MTQLYIANKNYSSWSLRPWVLMRELGIPFEEKLFCFDEGSSWESFREFSPTGLVPCLVAHDGTTVWESLAIVEFLAESRDDVWPDDVAARAWARCAAAEMHAGFLALRSQCPMNVGLRVRHHEVTPELDRDTARLRALWEQGLEQFGGPFLAGEEFTAVDAFFAPVAFRAATFRLDLGEVCREYVDRLLALDSMRDWTQAALAEPWREPGHEEEILALGEVERDDRAAPSARQQ